MVGALFSSCVSARIENPLPPEALEGVSQVCLERVESEDFAGVQRVPYLDVPQKIMDLLGIEVAGCENSQARIQVFTRSRPLGAS
ncbi:MAG: hypothetical protein CMN76_19020 [Spirochaetaceae bacterium]|nr:hypothetical protein [Spirochaetaceae bacterium]|tara:strand:- start:107568 stop:107822 length:255 start_codon:yes stop_codon:yes gene_type:complete